MNDKQFEQAKKQLREEMNAIGCGWINGNYIKPPKEYALREEEFSCISMINSILCYTIRGAKVMGESKWGSAYEIWQVKTFRQNKTIKNDIPLEVGHELEEMIARRYEKQTGFTVREANSVAMVGMPFLVGNFDRVVFDKAPEEGGKIIGGLECKTTGINNSVVVNGVMRSKWGKANISDGTTLVQES